MFTYAHLNPLESLRQHSKDNRKTPNSLVLGFSLSQIEIKGFHKPPMPLASVDTEQYIGQSCTALCRPFRFHVHPFLSSGSLCHLQHEEAAAATLVFNTCSPQLSSRLNFSFLLVTWVDIMLSEPWPEMNRQCSQSPVREGSCVGKYCSNLSWEIKTSWRQCPGLVCRVTWLQDLSNCTCSFSTSMSQLV